MEMSRDEIINLLKELGLKENIIKHVIAVEELSLETAKLILKNNPDMEIDLKLLSDGALLHDIGRSFTHSINHAVEGVKIAKKYGFDDRILRIIENHIGAGITLEEAKGLNLPIKDYIPCSIEEKIVANADNLLAGDKKRDIIVLYNKLVKMDNQEAADRVIVLYNEILGLMGQNESKRHSNAVSIQNL